VLRTTDFGVFAEINDEVEGLVYSSEIESSTDKPIEEAYREGDEVKARIIKIEPEERKIGLSLKNVSSDKKKPDNAEETS
jgi:ribosomal protein S1